jgi:hypothetical protein
MSVDLFPIDFIDELNIPDSIIEKCKKAYTYYGKKEAYKTLNTLLYSETPNEAERSLYLYRKAILRGVDLRDLPRLSNNNFPSDLYYK